MRSLKFSISAILLLITGLSVVFASQSRLGLPGVVGGIMSSWGAIAGSLLIWLGLQETKTDRLFLVLIGCLLVFPSVGFLAYILWFS